MGKPKDWREGSTSLGKGVRVPSRFFDGYLPLLFAVFQIRILLNFDTLLLTTV